MSFLEDIAFCLRPRCPQCRQGRLFRPWSLDVVRTCAHCGADLGQNDVGDGASVFMLFILGVTIIPSAWALELAFSPPMWVQLLLWACVSLAAIAVLMPAIKAYIMLLEYRHRRGA